MRVRDQNRRWWWHRVQRRDRLWCQVRGQGRRWRWQEQGHISALDVRMEPLQMPPAVSRQELPPSAPPPSAKHPVSPVAEAHGIAEHRQASAQCHFGALVYASRVSFFICVLNARVCILNARVCILNARACILNARAYILNARAYILNARRMRVECAFNAP